VKFHIFFGKSAFVRVAGLILTVFIGLSGCRKGPRLETSVYRLIDLLRIENVVRSPLSGLSAAELASDRYPVESYPPANYPDNPLGLVRRHTIGNAESKVIFAPPGTEFRFDLDLPPDPVLSFALGVVRDANSAAAMSDESEKNGGVEFIIHLEAEGRREVVFRKHFELPPVRESRTLSYSPFRLEIPAGEGKARLRFITGGSKGAFALWYHPILYARRQDRPNVVLVSVDTLRADHVGAYGYGRNTTPHLDALAAGSAVFRNVFAPSSWTLPSHVSMLTGLECRRHGVYFENDRMDPSLPTLAALLKDRGYVCGAVTGGGFVSPFYGFSRGFDSYHIGNGDLSDPNLAAYAGADAERWLEQNGDMPFFLFLHTYQPHSPYRSPEDYARKYTGPNPKWLSWDFQADHGGWTNIFRPLPEAERQNVIGLYDGEIRYTDDALIGPLVEKLKALGLFDRTLLIVTSDHGEEFFEHGAWVHTWSLYGESLKVPLVVKFPGGKHAGRKVDPIVRLTDLAPTVLDVLGIEIPAGMFDGRSLVPLLEGREREDRSVLAEIAADVVENHGPARSAAGSGRDFLILNGPYKKENLSRFATPPPAMTPLELYDLAKDPGLEKNIAGAPAKTEVVRALTRAADLSSLESRTKTARKLSKEMESQLRALGYIK